MIKDKFCTDHLARTEYIYPEK